jgi:proteasome lid subunit RPN8/RPN11
MNIYLTEDVHRRMMAYFRLASGEISGLGRSTLSDDRESIIITDIWLWDQECTDSTTETVDHDSVFSLVADLVEQGVPMADLNVWWHSHVDMPAYFSGTDRTCIDEWVNNRFLVAVVGNRCSEFKGIISIKEPIPCELDATVSILRDDELSAEEEDKIKKEIKEKVKIKTPSVQGFYPRYSVKKKRKKRLH